MSFDVLDTPADPRFDAFVRLASQIYDVPISLISLIDDKRQWFKAAIGLDTPETARELAFCAHAILSPNEVMVVEDTWEDPRFADNLLVTGSPEIRFYAGAPILSEAQHPLGTICIIDREPRTLDAAGRSRLADLAIGVGSAFERHRNSVNLHRAATHDLLTGLANRRLFEPRLEAAAVIAQTGVDCALLCLDVDHFKSINDHYGYAGGDAVLRVVGERLQHLVRETDLAARLGGDEFVVLLSGPLAPNAARTFAERIMGAFAAPISLGGVAVQVETSIGFATAPADGMDGRSLLRAAEMALHGAKSAGRRTILGAQDTPIPSASSNRALEADLREALAAGAFTLNWQPYSDLGSGATVGHEALIRWNRPGHGVVSPSIFVPVAESSGLVSELDPWILEAACRAAAGWTQPQHVSVNISPYWFGAGSLVDLVTSVLSRTGLDPSRLTIEITERTVIEQPAVARALIQELKAIGVRVALDDFGTGYSALASLNTFAFDALKLDRAFVQDLGQERRAEAVSSAIIQLAHALDMTVCAEGVETRAQLDFLRAAGCDTVQGYLLGPPTPIPQLTGAEC